MHFHLVLMKVDIKNALITNRKKKKILSKNNPTVIELIPINVYFNQLNIFFF